MKIKSLLPIALGAVGLMAFASAASASESPMGHVSSTIKLTVKGPKEIGNHSTYVRYADPSEKAWGVHGAGATSLVGSVFPGGAFYIRIADTMIRPAAHCVLGANDALNGFDLREAYCDASHTRSVSISTYQSDDGVWVDPDFPLPVSINTGEGDDWARGGAADDTIKTGAGNDHDVFGAGGSDRIDLGKGNGPQDASGDNYPGAEDFFTVGPDGADNLKGLGPNVTLNGQGGDDFLLTGPGDDTLIGGTGADKMIAGNGDDLIDATETPATADLQINCGGGTDTYLPDVGIDPPGSACAL